MSKKKLSAWTKLKYGVGDFGMSVVTAMLQFSMLFYYTDVVGVKPGLAGTAILVGKITWDLVNDVLFGYLEDRTKSKWGKRRPYLIFCALPFALSFWLVFSIHEGYDGYLLFVPSHHAPEFAPEGKHCLTIYTVCPDTLAEGTWEEKAQEYAEKLISLAERQIPDLHAHITSMKIMTAADYRKFTHMKKSSFGGVVPIKGQKNPPHITPVHNLIFVGQQSENAGGLGNVMLGAKSAYSKAFNK